MSIFGSYTTNVVVNYIGIMVAAVVGIVSLGFCAYYFAEEFERQLERMEKQAVRDEPSSAEEDAMRGEPSSTEDDAFVLDGRYKLFINRSRVTVRELGSLDDDEFDTNIFTSPSQNPEKKRSLSM